MKRLLGFACIFLIVLSLASCVSHTETPETGDESSRIESETNDKSSYNEAKKEDKPSRINVIGTFFLEPSAELDLSEEDLDPVQRYLFVVYDVACSDVKNDDLSPFDHSISITFNDANEYEQLSSYTGNLLRNFLENCGYPVSTNYGTLWGGGEPVRMVAAFAINKNDFKEGCTAKIEFQLADGLNASLDIAGADIQTIHWMDGIFAIEENPEAYQITQSVKIRARICQEALKQASRLDKNGDFALRDGSLAIAQLMIMPETPWGISCASEWGNTLMGSDLPSFDVESVRLFAPVIADKIESINSCLQTLCNELDKDNPDYDSANAANRQALSDLNDIISSFES